MRRLELRAERWPIAGRFAIARGSKSVAEPVVVEIAEGRAAGRGECVPYAHYGENLPGVMAAIEALRGALEAGMDRDALAAALPAGAARNAVDCALWDLEAKRTGRRVWELAGLAPPQPLVTAYTISLDAPEAMAAAARTHADRPLLKVKVGGEGVLDRVGAVRASAPAARLILDANEAWTAPQLAQLAPALAALGVETIEQPLPAGADAALDGMYRPVPLCADESCHDRASLDGLAGRYDAINIKLDKTGGLTEALALRDEARRRGFLVMVGSMVATSLAMAPAFLVAQGARWVDLDGPLLLARDREPGLRLAGSRLEPPGPELWG